MTGDEAEDGHPGEMEAQDRRESASSSDNDSSKRSGSGVDDLSASNADEDSSGMVQDPATSDVDGPAPHETDQASSSAAQDPATSEGVGLTERQLSKLPIQSTGDERESRRQSLELAAAERLAEANTKRNRGEKKRSMSAGCPAAVSGSGGTYRRRSFTTPLKPLKSIANLFRSKHGTQDGCSGPQVESSEQANSQQPSRLSARRKSEPTVYFKKAVRVKKVDCSTDGDPPAALPQTPVVEEELREGGVILNEAGRKAAKLEKGQRAYTADFERRMANSRRSSTSSQGRSSSSGVPPAVMAAVDEMDQLQLSRGRLPTNQERRASIQAEPNSERSSIDQDTVSSPCSDQVSEEESTDRDASATQTGEAFTEASTSQANSAANTQAGQDSGPSNQADSNPSAQDGEVAEQSSINRENVPPSVQARTSNDNSSNSNPNDHSIVPEDNCKAHDDSTPSDYIVRAQLEIVYDQDPSTAIQSLSFTSGLPCRVFAPRESDFHYFPAEDYMESEGFSQSAQANLPKEVSSKQSERFEQRAEGSHVVTQQGGILRFLSRIAHCLDECGNQLYPDSSDAAPASESESILECPNDWQAEKTTECCSSITESIVNENEWLKDTHSSTHEAAYEGSKPTSPTTCFTDRRLISECAEHKSKQPYTCNTSSFLILPIDGSYRGCHGPACDEPTMSELGVSHASPPQVRDNSDFGTTLEAAYNTSCSVLAPSGCPETLMPLNRVRRSSTQPMDNQLMDSSDSAAAPASMRAVDCDTETKLLRLQSWLYPSNGPLSEVECESARLPKPPVFGGVPLTKLSDFSLTTEAHVGNHHSSCTTLAGSHVDTSAIPEELPSDTLHAESDVNESPLRPTSSSSASSQCSVITAFNDPRFVTREDPHELASSIFAFEKDFLNDCGNSDSNLVALGKSATQASAPLQDESEDTHLASPNSSPKRTGSGSTSSSVLSVVTTFTSHSQGSATSKTSKRSSSSSGSSGSSLISFGLDGKSQSWTPLVKKSQASVGTNEGLDVLSLTGTTNKSPKARSAPNMRAIRKFVLKNSAVQPEHRAKKQKPRVEKRMPLGHVWHGGEVAGGEARYDVFDVPEEAEEPASNGIDAVGSLATGHEDESPSRMAIIGDEN